MSDSSPGRLGLLPEHILTEINGLRNYGLRVVLFGGWAKDLYRGWPGGSHGDLDLLIVADRMDCCDAFVRDHGRRPIREKRHAHKRAYRHGDLLVELFHVEPTESGFATHCYGHYWHHWRTPLAHPIELSGTVRIDAVTPENIRLYEQNHHLVEDAFYTAYPGFHEKIKRLYGDTRFPYHGDLWPTSGKDAGGTG